MARTYSEVPEPRYVERAKFADNGGGGGDIVKVSIVVNAEDPNDSYLDITAKELFELFQAGKIIYANASFTQSEEGYSETESQSTPIIGGYKEIVEGPEGYTLYQFSVIETHGFITFEAHADDEKPVMSN